MHERRSRRLLPWMLAAASLLLVASLPVAQTGAYWTTSVTGATASAGLGEWCAVPATSTVGNRVIPFNTGTTAVPDVAGSPNNRHIAIIPVANNASWRTATPPVPTGNKLTVRAWSCETTVPTTSLRVTAWANPVGAGTTYTPPGLGAQPINLNRTWLAGSETITSSSRLDPSVGLGLNLRNSATAATVFADRPLLGSAAGDGLRYSWIIANGRVKTNPATDPATCQILLASVGNCTFQIQSAANNVDTSFDNIFDTTPYVTEGEHDYTTYTARTYANQSPTGWSGSWLNCPITGLTCTTAGAAVTMAQTALTDAQALASTNGNNFQWLVVQWTGATTPPADLSLEVSFE